MASASDGKMTTSESRTMSLENVQADGRRREADADDDQHRNSKPDRHLPTASPDPDRRVFDSEEDSAATRIIANEIIAARARPW